MASTEIDTFSASQPRNRGIGGRLANTKNYIYNSQSGEFFGRNASSWADDDLQHSLQATFLASGQGRPPNPPKLPCTNGLLLRFYGMKNQSQSSWDTVQAWLGRMFPKFPERKFRKLIEGCAAEALLLTHEQRQEFYSKEINLNFIGQFCEELGISRAAFSDFTVAPTVSLSAITNGVIRELYMFCEGEKIDMKQLYLFIEHVTKHQLGEFKTFSTKVKKVHTQFKKLNKSGDRNMKASIFLKEQFLTHHVSTAASGSESEKPCTPKTKSADPTKKLHAKVRDLYDENEQQRLENSVLKEQLRENRSQIVVVESSLARAEAENGKLKERLAKSMAELQEKENKCRQLKTECASIRQSNFYSRLKRKEKKLEQNKEHIQKQSNSTYKSENVVLTGLKRKIKSQQTMLSNQRSVSRDLRKSLRESQKEISQLKGLISVLEADIMSREDCVLETRGTRRQFLDNIRKCVIQLQGENGVAAKNCGPVIQTVAKWVFGCELSRQDVPSASSAVNMADEGHVLAKYHIAESLVATERWNLHADGTTRDHKKIVGQQVTLSDGTSLSAGFTSVSVEDSATLLDVAIGTLKDLADLYAGETSSVDNLFHEMLGKLFATMSDRASKMKLWNKELNKYKKTEDSSSSDIHALYCNAHFLLGLSNQCDQVLKTVEAKLEEKSGIKLGRSNLAMFAHFKSAETNTGRFIRTACDVLGPRGDEKNGCRHEWEAYLKQTNQKSCVTSFRSNRFNNFFLGAAGLYHHRADIVKFISELKSGANLKVQSVLADTMSPEIMTLVRVLGLLYFKVTGPYWSLLKSETTYADFYKYVQQMHLKFQEWAEEPASLFKIDSEPLFPEFTLAQSAIEGSLYTETVDSDTREAVQALLCGFRDVLERQLGDFLPDGKYGQQPDAEIVEEMRHCKLTNLLGEYVFGDLDFHQKTKRHTSLHHHSTLNMLKRNKTMSEWLKLKDLHTQEDLMRLARKKGGASRAKDKQVEEKVVQEIQARLEENRKQKERKLQRKNSRKRKLIASVVKQGGVCSSHDQVNKLLRGKTEKQKYELLKFQFRYLKDVLGIQTKQKFKGASVTDLETNLVKLIKINRDSLLQPVSLPAASDEDIADSDSDHAESDVTDAEEITEEMEVDVDPFRFTRQGVTVAVAYNEGVFLGQVVNINTETEGTIQFMTHLSKDRFRWPSIDQTEVVASKYIVEAEFELLPAGRAVIVPNFAKIVAKYKAYKEKYM